LRPAQEKQGTNEARTALDRFRALAYASVVLTFALILVGGAVRVSDSGLGCGPGGSGTKGWPLCGGRVVPLIDENMLIEYAHRVLAGSLAVAIAALALLAWRRHRERVDLVRLSIGAFALVLFQATLGGLTVENGLEEELVATHLGIAMLQLGVLMVLARAARPGGLRESAGATEAGAGMRALAVASLIAVLATIVAGGYMSANQRHGTGEPTPAVHTACGNDFPSCGGEFLPFGRSRELDIHLAHRAFMYVASAIVLALLAAALRRRREGPDGGLARATAVAAGILCIQVLLGALNVWLGEHAWLVILHLATATVLWASLVYAGLLALRAPRGARVPGRRHEAEAVPA
jgi:heme A synthase